MRILKCFAVITVALGLTGSVHAQAQPPVNPGSIVWGANLPKVTSPAAGQTTGSIEVGGTFTENAGWKLSGVLLYINAVQPGGQLGPNLGGANAGDPILLAYATWLDPLANPAAPPLKIWGKTDPLANPASRPVINYIKDGLPPGKYQVLPGAVFTENPAPAVGQPRTIPKLGLAIIVEIKAPPQQNPGPGMEEPVVPIGG